MAKRGFKWQVLSLLLAVTIWCALAPSASARAASGACEAPPKNAVVALPSPLSEWGSLICTPQGYVITAKEGWIWTEPLLANSVFIPAQMVQQEPALLGSRAYFSKIDLQPASDAEFDSARDLAFSDFDEYKPDRIKGYRLEVTSYTGKLLKLYFFVDGQTPWGIWCPSGKCRKSSVFMILNMAKKP